MGVIVEFHFDFGSPNAYLSHPEVIVAALDGSGLPGRDILAATQDPEVKAQLLANTEDSVRRGVFGSPSFFVGEALFFGKDRLREVEEETLCQLAAAK